MFKADEIVEAMPQIWDERGKKLSFFSLIGLRSIMQTTLNVFQLVTYKKKKRKAGF